ncbi:acyl-CoA dehydrogenase [Pseudomonas aeruginosa]|nr:acyl-CoA dehydrogenase [Pseudomonas aeruginosa]
MDFDLTEEQRLLVESARAFARHELAPKAADWDRDHHFPVEVIRAAAEQGYLGLYIAEEDGGLGLSRLSTSLIFEQLAAGCVATTAYISIHNMAAWMLASFGDAALKKAWLPGLIGGESLASYCLTEPDAGSDAARLRTRARREGDEYVLDGSKCFISGAGSTQVLIVMARTGEDGARGISCFLVPADAPGIRYGRNEDKMGWRAQPTRTITFEGVRIPAGNRIGPEGQGFVYAMKGLDGGRLNIASCSLGAAQAALEQSMRYVEEREQFGKPLATFQALQFKLADMLTELTGQPPDGPPRRPSAGPRRRRGDPVLRNGQALRHRPLLRCLPTRPCNCTAATAISTIIRWSAGYATPACTRSSKAPTKSCG